MSMRQRLGESAFLMACVAAAVLSTTAISALPLYLDSVEFLALARMAKKLPPSGNGGWVQVREIAFNPGAIDATVDALDGAEDVLGRLARGKTVIVRSGRLSARALDNSSVATSGGWHYQSIAGNNPEIEFVSGTAPAEGELVEVAIAATAAETLGIKVGDRFQLTVPPTDIKHSIATVVGTFQPADRDGLYWQGLYDTLMAPDPASSGGTPPTIALTDDATLRRLASGSVADLGEVWALYYADTEYMMRLGVEGSLGAIEGFRSYISQSLPTAFSVAGIQSALETVRLQLSFTRLSMQLVGSLLISFLAIVLFALARMVSSIRDFDRSRLEARGATRNQVVKSFTTHGFLLLVVPTAIGPLLSASVLPFLGRTTGFAEVSGGQSLSWSLTAEQFALAIAISLAVTVYYFYPAVSARIGPVYQSLLSGRRGSRPWIWRANLDIMVIVAALALVYEAVSRGGFVTSDGEVSATGPTLPVAASIIVALVGLRVLRTLGGALGKISDLPWPSSLGVTLEIFSRSVMKHATPTLIAGGVMAVAFLSLGLQTTVATNASHQAAFASVSDIRLTNLDRQLANENSDVQRIEQLNWVDRVAWGIRTPARAGATDRSPKFNLLALQTEPFAEIAWFRDDFAGQRLDDLMDAIADYAIPNGLVLPEGATGLTLQGRFEHEGSGRIDLWARVSDSTGNTHTLVMENTQSISPTNGVQEFASRIDPDIQRPVMLTAFVVYEPPVSPLGTSVELELHSIETISRDGSVFVITRFEDASLWHPVESSIPNNTTIKALHDASGFVGGLAISMGRGTDGGLRGIYFSSSGPFSVPLLVNESFLTETGLVVGDSFAGNTLGRFIPFAIRGSYTLFPSHNSPGAPNAVTNVNALLGYIAPVSEPFLGDSAELVASIRGDITATQRREDVKGINSSIGIVDRALIESGSAGDLASVAGWQYVGIGASIIATVVGCVALFAFGVRFLVDGVRERALMESIGSSRRFAKIDGSVRLAIPVAFGLAIGAVSGAIGVAWIASNLTRGSDGAVAVPPLQLVVPWPAIAFIALLILAVTVMPVVLNDLGKPRGIASRLRSVATM